MGFKKSEQQVREDHHASTGEKAKRQRTGLVRCLRLRIEQPSPSSGNKKEKPKNIVYISVTFFLFKKRNFVRFKAFHSNRLPLVVHFVALRPTNVSMLWLNPKKSIIKYCMRTVKSPFSKGTSMTNRGMKSTASPAMMLCTTRSATYWGVNVGISHGNRPSETPANIPVEM